MIEYHYTYLRTITTSSKLDQKYVKKKVKNHEKSMEAMTNKKKTSTMDNDNIDIIKTIKEFTPISGFIFTDS